MALKSATILKSGTSYISTLHCTWVGNAGWLALWTDGRPSRRAFPGGAEPFGTVWHEVGRAAYTGIATHTISVLLSSKGERSKSPYSSTTSNPHATSRWYTSQR